MDSPPHAQNQNNRLLNFVSAQSTNDDYFDDDYLSLDTGSSHTVIDGDDNIKLPFSWKKLWQFTGPGFLMSISFLDPGNLEGDLQADFIGQDWGGHGEARMAEICRDEYPRWASFLLWCMAELALISADIQEVIGSAIAINILSNGLVPLWAGVIITASDCFLFLFLENYGVRKLEAVFAVLIATMALSFAWMFADTKPDAKQLLIGPNLIN
ncbi:hypothetical protein ACET3Z_032838 [Daucus carota]